MFDEGQINAFDTGAPVLHMALRLSLAGLEFFLVPESRGHVPAGFDYGIPCITSISSAADYGFDLAAVLRNDQIAALTVTAANVNLPIHSQSGTIPVRYTRGRLSDYLSQHCLAGPESDVPPTLYGYRPAQAAFFIRAETPQSANYPDETKPFYMFKGLMHDFEVSGDGASVTMRFVEDTRWDRRMPYPIHRRNFQLAPQDSQGLGFPICYGQHATWHHKDFPQDAQGPFGGYMPMFPVCMNLAPTVCTAIYKQTDTGYQYDSEWLVSRHGLGIEGLDNSLSGWKTKGLFVPYGPDLVAIINPVFDAVNRDGTGFLMRVLDEGGSYTTAEGARDLLWTGIARPQDKYTGIAQILPLRRVTAAISIIDNLATIFNPDHRRRGPPNLIDGDRYSWFRDDVSTPTVQRRVVFELGGTYPNLGAVLDLRLVVAARRRVGTGTLTVTGYLDVSSTVDSVTTPAITLTAGTDGYAFGSQDFTPNPLTQATHIERWEFMQVDVNPHQPMKLAIGWTKSVWTDTWDIIHVGLLVKFNPHRKFLEYRERLETRVVEDFDLSGRGGRYTVIDKYLDKVYGVSRPEQLKTVYYGGWANGRAGDSWSDPVWIGAPATWKTLQNPAQILRDAIQTYGGKDLDNANPAWPPIASEQFDTSPGSVRNFNLTASVLNLGVIEAAALGTSETFKLGLDFADWPGVRELVRAIQGSVPGLRIVTIPDKSPNDTDDYRVSYGCIWPIVDTTVNYRRKINPQVDTVQVNWAMTPRGGVINDLQMRYGFSTVKGTYCRQLLANYDLFDHGMPFNTRNSGSTESVVTDYVATAMSIVLDESYVRYGKMTHKVDLPFVFRWHEALAIRNWLFRWFAFQRVRVSMLVNTRIIDLLPGDVFAFDTTADSYFDCQFPLQQLPGLGSATWSSANWLVERVNYIVGGNGELMANVVAIFNKRIAE